MVEYEVTFRVEPLSEELETKIESELDAFCGGHGKVHTVTASTFANTGLAAADSLARSLASLGAGVIGVEPDLVTAATIAKRAHTTRQAVGNWARGDRRTSSPFPSPAVLAGGGLWRWSEVNDWLRQHRKPHDAVHYLTVDDEVCLNYRLLTRRRAAAVSLDGRWQPVSELRPPPASTASRSGQSKQRGSRGKGPNRTQSSYKLTPRVAG